MAARMPHSLIANYAPSSLWLSLPMLPVSSGRGKYPASPWAIHWETRTAGGLARAAGILKSGGKSITTAQWCTAPTGNTSLPNYLPSFLLTFTPLCGGLYSQFQTGSGTNVSFEIIDSQCDRSGTSSRICLRHQSHKADLCSWVLTGSLVFFYSKGQLSSWSYSYNINITETENLQWVQASFVPLLPPPILHSLTSDSLFSQFWCCTSINPLHSRSRILSNTMFTT